MLWAGVAADFGPAVCPARIAAAASNHGIRRYITHMRRALVVAALLLAASPASAGTKLIEAVKRGDAAAVRALIAQKAPGNDINASDPDGSTALHWAVQRDDVALIDMLLAAGADVKAATRYKITPLSLACTNGNARVVDRLLKAGADPNAVSEEGQTALMTASLTGTPDAVRLLLEAGANVNAVEPYKGQTALMWAASEGNASA